MRIAVWHNLPSGGGKRALHDHVRGLVGRGHSVESWSPPAADHSYMAIGPYCREHLVDWDREVPTPRGRIGRWTRLYREAIAGIEAMDRHARECAAAMDEGGFDVLFANSCQYHAVSPVARYVKIPSVLYLQEPYRIFYEARPFWDQTRLIWVAPSAPPWPPPDRLRPFGLHRVDRLRWKFDTLIHELNQVQSIRLQAREELASARAFGSILCNSLFSRESIFRAYGLESTVCSLGIDTEAFLPSEDKQPYVVGLGALRPWKGIDRAILGLSRIPAHSRPTLVWIGNNPDPHHLADVATMAEDLGVCFEPRVMVSQEDLVAILGRAAAMVYTSRLEPFGYAPLEANACGTVVVGVAEGGIRESIQPGLNGVLVDPGDADALGRAVQVYVENLRLAREHGLRARRHVVEHWGLAESIDRLEALALACSRPIVYSHGAR